MNDILFLSSGFNQYQIGLARKGQWICCQEKVGNLSDDLYKALSPCIEVCNFDDLSIFLLNGPGSTLGVRALCAFVRTCLALKKLQRDQVFICDQLHFAQAYLLQKNPSRKAIICARVNLTTVLCLAEGDIHVASEEEKTNAIWLPHPCLSEDLPIFSFCLSDILPLFSMETLWQQDASPDVFTM